MKKKLLIFCVTLLLLSCSKKLIPNDQDNGYLINQINKEIKAGKASDKTPIYLNNDKISAEELRQLNSFEAKEFIGVKVLSKLEAKSMIDESIDEKVILIEPFVDELFGQKYYSKIEQKFINDIIIKLTKTKQTKSNPILILNGIPLRGDEIYLKINKIQKSEIKSVNLLKKPTAYALYGIRAMNGAIIITTKE